MHPQKILTEQIPKKTAPCSHINSFSSVQNDKLLSNHMYCRQLQMHQFKPSRWRKVKSRELQCWQRKKNRYEPIYWYFILYYMHFTRVDLGVGRRGPGHPFFFEILWYFYRILRKIKSIYTAGIRNLKIRGREARTGTGLEE